LIDLPVVARAKIPDATPGQRLDLRLEAVDPTKRRLTFVPAV
jgi:RNase II-type exonuclease C-terminal S1 domain